MGPGGCFRESELIPVRLAASSPPIPMFGYWNWIVALARSRITRNISLSPIAPVASKSPLESHSTTNFPGYAVLLVRTWPYVAKGESCLLIQSAQYGAMKFFGIKPEARFGGPGPPGGGRW